MSLPAPLVKYDAPQSLPAFEDGILCHLDGSGVFEEHCPVHAAGLSVPENVLGLVLDHVDYTVGQVRILKAFMTVEAAVDELNFAKEKRVECVLVSKF